MCSRSWWLLWHHNEGRRRLRLCPAPYLAKHDMREAVAGDGDQLPSKAVQLTECHCLQRDTQQSKRSQRSLRTFRVAILNIQEPGKHIVCLSGCETTISSLYFFQLIQNSLTNKKSELTCIQAFQAVGRDPAFFHREKREKGKREGSCRNDSGRARSGDLQCVRLT
jgi:hypothetical protein